MDTQLEDSQKYLQTLVKLRSDKPTYDKAPILRGSVLVLCDAQMPYQDGEFIYRMLELAQAWGIKRGISAGDFFNQAAFSFFMYPPEERVWHDEQKKAKEVAQALKTFIPKWTFLLGNHDAHILKQMFHQINHEDMGRLYDISRGFSFSDYWWCVVRDRKGNEWRISHPRNTSVVHGRVPTRLALKYQQNIVAGHGHLTGLSPDDSGKFLCIDVGVCCEPLKLDYTNERDSLRPRMNKGAVILKEVDGRIYPYHIMPEWADWEALKKLYS